MVTTNVRCGKAFSAEQKIRELKSRISKLKAISEKSKTKIPPTTIIKELAENMNNIKSQRYGVSSNNIERKSVTSEQFKMLFNPKRFSK